MIQKYLYDIPGAAYAGEPQHVASGIIKLVLGSEARPKSMILIF